MWIESRGEAKEGHREKEEKILFHFECCLITPYNSNALATFRGGEEGRAATRKKKTQEEEREAVERVKKEREI